MTVADLVNLYQTFIDASLQNAVAEQTPSKCL